MRYYKIDNGTLIEIDEETGKKLSKNSDRYALTCVNDPEVCLFDFDKHALRPYVKDYLNRRWASRESRAMIFCGIMCAFSLVFSFYSAKQAEGVAKSNIDMVTRLNERNDIIDKLRHNGQ